MARYIVAAVEEIPPGERKIVELAGRSIGVFNLGGEFFALRNRCPHQGGPLCAGSLGGLIAIQVVEHLDPGYLLRLIETTFHKLRPGAPLVFETINAACWVAFFDSYIRDITHRWPLHPDTLRYLVQASGFASVEIRFRSPVPYSDKLDRVSLPAAGPNAVRDETLIEIVEALNAHAEKLNARLFTHLDYAVVARR